MADNVATRAFDSAKQFILANKKALTIGFAIGLVIGLLF